MENSQLSSKEVIICNSNNTSGTEYLREPAYHHSEKLP